MADFINTIDALGDDAVVDSIINRTITEFKDNTLTNVGQFAFYNCTDLTDVAAPNATQIEKYAFYGCSNLDDVDFPCVTSVGAYAFVNCPLANVNLPKLTALPDLGNVFDGAGKDTNAVFQSLNTVGSDSFRYSLFTQIDLPVCTFINDRAFYGAINLNTLILRSDTVCTLNSENALQGPVDDALTPIAKGTGYIYVPSALVDSYNAETNWSTFANQFRKLEEWTVDGTVTGELATNKHMVRFFNSDGTLLGYRVVTTGESATYDGDTPVSPYGSADDYPFTGWEPSPTNITADTDCYAQYATGAPTATDADGAYGVEWDYSQSSTALTRLGLAASFSDPVPATSLTETGSSPFDEIMPWAGIKKYNIIDGAIAYSEDDEGFSMTDYDTVVYIPEFYYTAYKDTENQKWIWAISPTEKDGYVLHPGSGRYIGRYHTSGDSSAVYSKSGVAPLVSTSRTNFRTYSHNKGSNWWMLDIATWSALQLLYLVEFADFNSQSKLGKGNGSSSLVSGASDGAVYHTVNGGDTYNQYRWVEQPFGRCYDWVDGFMTYSRRCYLETRTNRFGDDISNLTDSGVTLPSTSYTTGFGYSKKFPWAFLPDTAGGGSSSTFISDYVVSGASYRALYVGGGYVSDVVCGFWYFNSYNGAASTSESLGSRLLYIP